MTNEDEHCGAVHLALLMVNREGPFCSMRPYVNLDADCVCGSGWMDSNDDKVSEIAQDEENEHDNIIKIPWFLSSGWLNIFNFGVWFSRLFGMALVVS